jgi:hypothetical protein
MEYWEEKLLVLTATPEKHKSQPTGFSGLREATRAPTVASITMVTLPSHQSKVGVFGWERFKRRRRRLSPVSAKTSAHSDHASQAAVRRLHPPTPRPFLLVPSVTTLIYGTTVFQPLRRTLLVSFLGRGERNVR